MRMPQAPKGRRNIALMSISFLLLAMLASIQPALADITSINEGSSINIGDNIIRLKNANNENGGYCRIRVDKLNEKSIKVGSVVELGQLYIQALSAAKDKCSLVVTPKTGTIEEKSYDAIDSLSVSQDANSAEKKRYEINGKSFTLEAVKDPKHEGVMFTITSDSGQQEKTDVIKKGSIYTLSEQSIITVIDLPASGNVKFGMKIAEIIPSQPQDIPDAAQKSTQEEMTEKQQQIEDMQAQEIENQVIIEKPVKRKATQKEIDQTQADLMIIRDEKARQKSKDSNKCEPGLCYANSGFNACLQQRTRIRLNDVPSYCDIDGNIKKQKEAGESAQFSYECNSNIIADGKCLPIHQQPTIFQKIINKLASIFG